MSLAWRLALTRSAKPFSQAAGQTLRNGGATGRAWIRMRPCASVVTRSSVAGGDGVAARQSGTAADSQAQVNSRAVGFMPPLKLAMPPSRARVLPLRSPRAFRLERSVNRLNPLPMLSDARQAELLKFAEALADVARSVLIPAHADPETRLEIKPDGSPVTWADKEAERLMRQLITKAYPTHGILGEEFGPQNVDAEFCWVLDPIDGTKSFLSRVPLYVTLIGLRYEGQPLLGLIDQPILDERIVGDGRTARLNGKTVRAAEVALKDAVVVSTDFDNVRRLHKRARWNRLADSVAHTRTWGDGYGHLLVASGRAHVVADPVMNPWDLVPVIPVLKGAGALVTDWQGGDAVASGNIIAAAPKLHAQVLATLND
ncbi:MAG: hypothetical protein B9S29_03525 [Opitutia bacterium Tous-C2FEB]|nr:MAG: hypothetical protein B9S29_03525 [Opitutae bacterium Tous-C2FEB]